MLHSVPTQEATRLTLCLIALGVRVHAAATPLRLQLAIAEALTASPALRAPDDARTVADIRQRQWAAAFGGLCGPVTQLTLVNVSAGTNSVASLSGLSLPVTCR